ncbi:UMP-CMP kinase 2, mitochondrial-like [Macrosteles quadrilineatus]|uniref:UMP-CMP kinase 2, mitochondrial-like n=1 Tax=Macrosteles quadrilineatus TaxID=74068 RepID=UPI0023E16F9B|nr:UMP-CMP kinase 2, mitochondrial-like [Macrosteles quadrilineatus]
MVSILQVWQDATVQFPNAKVMRSLFINKCFSSPTVWDNRFADRNRQPFINIESNSPKTRDKVAKALAARIKGQFVENPPKCLLPAWYIYRSPQHELHRVYYALGLYGMSHAVKVHWVKRPVVMTGYWFDRTTTTLADLFEDSPLPPEASSVYMFPKDLMKPDLTIFLDMGELAVEELEDPNISDEKPAGWVSRYTNIFRTFPTQLKIQSYTWSGESAENVTESLLQMIQSQLGRSLEQLTEIK